MNYTRKQRLKKWVATALCALIALSMLSRLHNYRKVIFAYQTLTETDFDTPSALAVIDKYVGRAHTPFDYQPRRPRYPHFWDEYNKFTYNNPINN